MEPNPAIEVNEKIFAPYSNDNKQRTAPVQ